MQNVVKQLLATEKAMNANFVERQAEIRAILLALVAKKNILLIGPPGVAKSSIIQQFIDAFTDVQSFTRLISPTTQPDELFGSAKFDRLKEGVIERNIDGQLPTAHFAFLDEIFKSTSDLLNGLLKIMNEHQFENGTDVLKTPLFTLIGASNEFPEEEELAALYDRFLLRREVESLKTPDDLMTMLRGSTTAVDVPPISLAQLQALQQLATEVVVPEHVLTQLVSIHFQLKEQGIPVSDRRTKQCLTILQAEALLNGRMQVVTNDLRALTDCLWIEAEDRDVVKAVIHEYVLTPLDHAFEKGDAFYSAVTTNVKAFDKAEDFAYKAYTSYASDTLNDWQTVKAEIEALVENDDDRARLASLSTNIERALTKVLL
ncbi:AAA family ATPase [Kurthia massiliensis]|uniref:AAA family ATPase n=1 Tax=Kurthia massiliensis TaxID=1033739 RepID=UPI0002883D1E|nr:AAA family ATPase [Kurthia massiliensis]